ncbi:HupE/UreJ family protein [Chitinophaga sp.]|uniref:HupE/UreJ family protein n=1 Tax=Chitinophaga sp. TaxID=1869181 RepID=UPI0031D551D0
MKGYILSALLLLSGICSFAHPMPSSVVTLSVLETSISGEAKMPLLDLEGALKMEADNNLNVNTQFFKNYFHQHIKAFSGQTLWATTIDSIGTEENVDINVGNYREVVVWFKMAPPAGKSLRSFLFDYDVIVHQIITHSILVFLKNDWKNGLHAENSGEPLGVITTNFKIGKFEPLTVDLEEGSWWKGFKSMLELGMQHIQEGTDHLLFLIVLLLPATLVATGKKWAGYAGTKYSLTRLLKIVTSFTIGHSITLLIGALGWCRPPAQPIEVLIALSILVSAIHALRPVFPGKEFFVAGGFGLIHGMAFAAALSGMGLGARILALSILGFNLGIELMQLFIVALIIPWLILLSQTKMYRWFRIAGAVTAGIVSIAWIVERCTGIPNFITGLIAAAYEYAIWAIVGLAVFSIGCYVWQHYGPVILSYKKVKE